MISRQHMGHVIPGGNGVFMPTIVSAGRVVGTWKREITARRVDLRFAPLKPLTASEMSALHRAALSYAAYLQLEANVVAPRETTS